MECWICLATEESIDDAFTSYCGCNERVRPVHSRCLARWQLQRAGRREETHCRFCNDRYTLDWRNSLASSTAAAAVNAAAGGVSTGAGSSGGGAQSAIAPAAVPRPPTPIMAIFFEGQVHRIKVYPGPEGKARFQQQIRELVQLRDDEEFEVEFECKAPDSGAVLHLDGMDAFDAATHCAALTAAERMTKTTQQQQPPQQQQQVQPSPQHQQHNRPRRRQQPARQATQRASAATATADVQLQLAADGGCP